MALWVIYIIGFILTYAKARHLTREEYKGYVVYDWKDVFLNFGRAIFSWGWLGLYYFGRFIDETNPPKFL